jgi:hypothetical protein
MIAHAGHITAFAVEDKIVLAREIARKVLATPLYVHPENAEAAKSQLTCLRL